MPHSLALRDFGMDSGQEDLGFLNQCGQICLDADQSVAVPIPLAYFECVQYIPSSSLTAFSLCCLLWGAVYPMVWYVIACPG